MDRRPGWQEVRLGDLVSVKHGWPFKSAHFHERLTGRPIVVNIGNFEYTGGFRFETTTIKEYRDDYPSEYELQAGEILLIMTCQTAGGEILGIPARVPDDGRVYLHNQRIGRVVCRCPDLVDPDYLYWLFRSPKFNRELVTTASGSKILHTSPSRIEAFRFELPPLSEQRRIARVLGALDDKIELNRRMNRTLESIARAIFKSWFVDFDPVRKKMEGGEGGLPPALAALPPSALPEVADVVYGVPFKSDMFNSSRVGRPVLRIRDLATHDPGVYTTESNPRETVVRPGDIVVGMDGEFRVHLWHGPPSLLNQRVCLFRPKPGVPRTYLIESLREPLDFIERSKTGTTVIHLGKSDIDRFSFPPSTEEALDALDGVTEPLLEQVVRNAAEAEVLTRARDLLLPRLVSDGVTNLSRDNMSLTTGGTV